MCKKVKIILGLLLMIILACSIGLYLIIRNGDSSISNCNNLITVERDGYEKPESDLSDEFTQLETVSTVHIGNAVNAGYLRNKNANGFDILKYLLQSGQIKTGVNLGSYNCIVRNTSDSRYDSSIVRTIYPICTNECYDEENYFMFTIDRKTGEITTRPYKNTFK